MFSKNKQWVIALLLFIIAFSSCTIQWDTLDEPGIGVDYSFLVTGKIAETGNLASVIESPHGPSLFPLSWRRKPQKPLPVSNILLKGQVGRPLFGSGPVAYFMPWVRVKYQEGNIIILLPKYLQRYLWDGSVVIDGHTVEAYIAFDAWGHNDGDGKRFILKKASLEQARLEFDDPFEINKGPEGVYLVGYVHISNNKHRLYAVHGSSPGRRLYENVIFYNPLQKFQFLDDGDEVTAELEKGIYTIYDTLPEAERENMKYAIALLTAFRHSTSVLREIGSAWKPPLFHRYVYP